MAAFRKGVKGDDLLKKMMRKLPTTLKELFDMADRYANQEAALTAEHDDRQQQEGQWRCSRVLQAKRPQAQVGGHDRRCRTRSARMASASR